MATYYIPYTVSSGVNVGFTAIMIVPLSVFMCISLYRARRTKDPARVATTYFRAMLPVAILWLLMYTISGIIQITYDQTSLDSDSTWYSALRINLCGDLFSCITSLLLIMTLAELGNGFLFCLAQRRTALQKTVRWAAVVSCAILSILAIAIFGVYNAAYSDYLSDIWDRYNGYSLREAGSNMNSAFGIIIFVWALLLLAFAAVVFHKAKRNHTLKNSAVLFLAAAILNLLTHLYVLIYLSVFILADIYYYSSYEVITALLFVDPILRIWTYTAVVALVFAIVVRKRDGLWTTMQAWMDQQGPPALASSANTKGLGEQWQQPSDNHVFGV